MTSSDDAESPVQVPRETLFAIIEALEALHHSLEPAIFWGICHAVKADALNYERTEDEAGKASEAALNSFSAAIEKLKLLSLA